jgi:hypothetical protein
MRYDTKVKICHSCKKELLLGRSVGRRDVCPACGSDVHCCLNCRFYDRSASKQCNEPVAEGVKEKARANFCSYFVLPETGPGGQTDTTTDQARKTLEDLFKK